MGEQSAGKAALRMSSVNVRKGNKGMKIGKGLAVEYPGFRGFGGGYSLHWRNKKVTVYQT